MKMIIALLALCTSAFVMSTTTPVRAQYGVEIGPGGVQVGPRDRDREYRDDRQDRDRRGDDEARARRRCNRLVDEGEYRSFRRCMTEQGY
jgi:hypothetical protein